MSQSGPKFEWYLVMAKAQIRIQNNHNRLLRGAFSGLFGFQQDWRSVPAQLGLILLLGLSACAPKKQEASCGFVQNTFGERISWNDRTPIPIYLHEDFPDAYVGAVKSAIKTWEDATGHKLFALSDGRVSGNPVPERDNTNVIYYLKSWDSSDTDEQGRTNTYVIGDQIVEADVLVNGRDFAYYWPPVDGRRVGVNIEALILHELGHVLGLKHNDGTASVMQTHLEPGNDRVNLTAADKSTMKCEY